MLLEHLAQVEVEERSRRCLERRLPVRSKLTDPHPPSVQCQIENADKYAGNRQNSCGDIGINKLVQVMEQKASLVWLDAGLGFRPVLKQRQGAWPRKQFRKNSPDQ